MRIMQAHALLLAASSLRRPVSAFSSAFTGSCRSVARFRQLRWTSSLPSSPEKRTSYEVDSDEESEQLLADRPIAFVPPLVTTTTTAVNGDVGGGRYAAVLEQVGLSNLKQVSRLPEIRPVSTNDVFCNRELRFGGIRAIGFDMDYTLAQYQQPAFDRLAFDGAKEKIVKALGYPEEVLNFEYDHTVRIMMLYRDFECTTSAHCSCLFYIEMGTWTDHRHRSKPLPMTFDLLVLRWTDSLFTQPLVCLYLISAEIS
jgi:5' nucleotidase family